MALSVSHGRRNHSQRTATCLHFIPANLKTRDTTWSNPSVVEEGDLTWGQINGIHSNNLHRIWQEVDISTRLVNWHQFSLDGGVTWSQPTSVTDPEEYIGSPNVTTDISGRLYLFQPIQITPQITGITYRIWDTERWLDEERIILDNQEGIYSKLSGYCNIANRQLILVYLEKDIDTTTGLINYTMSYADQTVEIPAVSSNS